MTDKVLLAALFARTQTPTSFADDQCFIWTGHFDNTPKYNKLQVRRIYFEATRGRTPDGVVTLYLTSCNQRCVNPDHLTDQTERQPYARRHRPRSR
jgi:hypothetical protein